MWFKLLNILILSISEPNQRTKNWCYFIFYRKSAVNASCIYIKSTIMTGSDTTVENPLMLVFFFFFFFFFCINIAKKKKKKKKRLHCMLHWTKMILWHGNRQDKPLNANLLGLLLFLHGRVSVLMANCWEADNADWLSGKGLQVPFTLECIMCQN